MATIRRPLSRSKGWKEISLYRAYSDKAHEAFSNGGYFEAIAVCGTALDVFLNTIALRLLELHKLDACQRQVLKTIQEEQLTAGAIIKRLSLACVLNARLLRALDLLNQQRNKVIHPMKAGSLKSGAITPTNVDKQEAAKILRLYDHVIDMAGGRSPRSEERALRQYISWRRELTRKKFPT